MNNGIVVLSLCAGMECGAIALKEMGIKVKKHYSVEVDKFCIQQIQHNFPSIELLGDIRTVDVAKIGHIDLILAGTPCQGFSRSGRGLNFDDPRSKLFFEAERIIKQALEINPEVKFMLENVKMNQASRDIISERLGVEPELINSAKVSAQNRQRYYWANWKIEQPEDQGLVIRDILQPIEEVAPKYFLSEKAVKGYMDRLVKNKAKGNGFGIRPHISGERKAHCIVTAEGRRQYTNFIEILKLNVNENPQKINQISPLKCSASKQPYQGDRIYAIGSKHPALCAKDEIGRICLIQLPRGNNAGNFHFEKSPTLTSSGWDRNNALAQNCFLRRLTPLECCRLQTVREWYEWIVSDTQTYKMLGNGWTVDVIKNNLSSLNLPEIGKGEASFYDNIAFNAIK